MSADTSVTTSLPARRVLHAVVGLGALGGAVALLGPWALALWFLPDLALLAGVREGFGTHGRLAPSAVPAYNAVHMVAGPVVLIAVGALTGGVLLGLGVLWLSHVALDRAMGYGLRTPEGEQRG